MEREITGTHPADRLSEEIAGNQIVELMEGELVTIELSTAQRVSRNLNELDNSDGGSRDSHCT
jgi:hypothetical protein